MIQPKQANTRQEQILLGLIAEEAARIEYGKIVLELTVFKGKPTNVQATEIKRSLNLND